MIPSHPLVLLVLTLLSCGVYLNSLTAGFTFDDNFAVINNGDVTDDNKSIWQLLQSDFWGQDIRSEQSHKSYRPLTVLSLRLQRKLGDFLPAVGPLPTAAGPKEVQTLPSQEPTSDHGLSPVPFHVANVLAHAVVTCLVYWLAYELCKAREKVGPAAASNNAPWRIEALLAGLLFACHPIHTEAIAGVVGHAELLGAAFAILAMLAYMAAANSPAGHPSSAAAVPRSDKGAPCRSNSTLAAQQRVAAMSWLPGLPEAAQHWALMALAALLTWAAALSKEIGITMAGSMVLYDVFLVPVPADMPAKAVTAASLGKEWRQRLQAAAARLLSMRKMARTACMAAVVLVYVRLRAWLAGDHLVRIFRKVENPIPFAEPTTRVLTTGYLHAKYASLLLAPLQLSADWSFACIPMVEQLTDPRNLATLALYACLLYILVAARPWQLVSDLLLRDKRGKQSVSEASLAAAAKPAKNEPANAVDARLTPKLPVQPVGKPPADKWPGQQTSLVPLHARWRLVIVGGLLLAPFFPASNVLFYVGTFIGERLLYTPSIGFCMLLADALMQLGGSTFQSWLLQACTVASQYLDSKPEPEQLRPVAQPTATSRSSTHGKASIWRAGLAAAMLVVLLTGYSWRTVLRNQDWQTEEHLFKAAQKVCWRSAKVQLNSGILERRYMRWRAALDHFELARDIEPSYCEPGYWIGLTLINQGTNIRRGLQELEHAVECKYVAVEAVKALHQIYKVLHTEQPAGARHLQAWARLLLQPSLNRVEDACEVLEQAALEVAFGQPGADYAGMTGPCEQHLDSQYQQNMTVSDQRRPSMAALQRCVAARRELLGMLVQHGPVAKQAKHVVYKYLHDHAGECRISTVMDGGEVVARPSQAHVQLMHKAQAADPEDPWMQREWGEVMNTEGRSAEASMHLEVTGFLLMQLAAQDKPASPKQTIYMSFPSMPKGTTQAALAQAAVEVFQRCLDVGAADECRVRLQLCQARSRVAAILGSSGTPPSVQERAEDQARQCQQELSALPNCN